ncbi:DctP family TRAP transporter solute-binding subunit [Pseudomonadota bacterium]
MSACRLILPVILVSVWVAGCSTEDADDVIVIKFPHVTAPATPKGQGAERIRELVQQRLGDRVKVEVYPSSQMMNDDDSLDALSLGEVQMIAVSLSKFDRLTSIFQVFDLPFLFRDLEAVESFQTSATGNQLLLSLENKGFLGLGFWHNGMKQLSGPKPLRVPGDAAGMSFRIMESDVLQSQIQALDAVPQKMALSEVYQALQTGAIDAQENTWSNIWSQKFFEVQPFITESNHGYIGYLFAVNSSFWRKLPADVREEMEAIIAEVTGEVNQRAQAINAEHRQLVLNSGQTELVLLTAEELSVWRQVMTPVWDKFTPQIGTEIMAAAQRSANSESSSPDSR